MDPTAVDVGLLILRVGVGLPFALHGAQKLFGWFGGGGLKGTSAWFASLGFGSGRTAALMAGTGELAGGIGLALGLLTPLAAAAVVGTMTTAAFVNNAEAGFWSVNKGWELNGYLIVVAAALAITGPGTLSLDTALGLSDRLLAGLGLALQGAPGAALVAVAFVGGWVRWATRSRGERQGPA
jgi:putative oxidoreductase